MAEIPVSVSLPLGQPTGRGGALGTDPGAIVQQVQAFANLGVQLLVIPGHTSDTAAILSGMDMLAREVLPVFT